MTDTPTFDDLTPPDELAHQWKWRAGKKEDLFAEIARWGARHGWEQGADAELNAVCNWIQNQVIHVTNYDFIAKLRAARRPRQPSLQEQALAAWERASFGKPGDRDLIRRALEQAGEGKA